MGGGIARDADVLDRFDSDAGGGQTITNRFGRKTGAMLYAIESLFLDRREQLSVFDERRGGVTVIGIYSEYVQCSILEFRFVFSNFNFKIGDL